MASPSILLMPPELQLEIFHAVHKAGDELLPVSQVCKLWRELSLNTSTFWTHISVDISSIDPAVLLDNSFSMDVCCKLFPWATTLLHRSGSQPIDVSVELQSEIYNSPSPIIPWTTAAMLMLQLIIPHAMRFRRLELVSDTWDPIRAFSASLFDLHMPMLEEWDVTMESSNLGLLSHSDLLLPLSDAAVLQCPVGINPSVDLHQALYPKLAHLSLSAVAHNWAQLLPRSLVTLNLSNLPLNSRPAYEELRTLLLGSQMTLMSLTLSASAPYQSDQPIPENDKLTLPNLRTLSLGITFAEAAMALATYLDVPALHCLEIHDMTHKNERTWASEENYATNNLHMYHFYLKVLLNWPMQQLTHLTLRSPCCPQDQDTFSALKCDFEAGRQPTHPPPIFSSLFFHCTSLKNLRLVDPDLNTFMAFNLAVVVRDGQPGILPCSALDFLHIETQNHWDLTQFLGQMTVHTWCSQSRLIARLIPTILLDVPPAWGASLREFLSPRVCKKLLNGEGYFDVEMDRLFNLMDNLLD
ncbi:hypothetical protein GGU10DRAFT_390806 [Lentinula aff. detonsa]|uniref:F-box domain-containing protein n=1 Tax=Lentinula aff. detonsa TaxID=2804958 RepID=A0AA38NJA9_9AGAR|nr:hypothetical protein GGU10DRAFT_390806 [Lentinula aff. detonsa]